MIRKILEAVDSSDVREDSPLVDELDIHTAGSTITTGVPGDDYEDAEDEDVSVEIEEARKRFRDDPEAAKVHGGMTRTGKMPCISYSTLAGATCPKGSELSKMPGSVCYGCYAKGGRYSMPSTKKAQIRRTKKTRAAIIDPVRREQWMESIVASIKKSGDDVFRWHDSGDIVGLDHLDMIVGVAHKMPQVRFWLPTKEHQLVEQWTVGNKVPPNMNIRLSAYNMFDVLRTRRPLTTSSVSSGSGYLCPATYDEDFMAKHENSCGPCRECWNRKTRNVDYKYHGSEKRYAASRKALGFED
jgi:hypothetical protein